MDARPTQESDLGKINSHLLREWIGEITACLWAVYIRASVPSATTLHRCLLCITLQYSAGWSRRVRRRCSCTRGW